MLAYVLCQNTQCRYVLISEDLRQSPSECPRCGGRLLTNCPRCGAILRRSTGVCDNCGNTFLPEEHPPAPPADGRRFARRLPAR